VTRRLPSRVYLLIGRIGRNRLVRRLHPALYHRFHGAAFLGRSMGCRTILLHTTGGRTGRPRTAPLYAFPVGEAPGAARAATGAGSAPTLAVVASNGGLGHPPAWYRNLRARPVAIVEDGDRRWSARARDVAGGERDRLWHLVNAAYPGYEAYQALTTDEIPVVVLEPLPEA
jgi:deazaflavin-dependent oxidoreductase (nitroreductase family)